MPTLLIDNRQIEVESGTTILEAARRLEIDIPTLCYREGGVPNTPCLVCIVKVNAEERLIPACATPVAEGMVVESGTEEVRAARRMALELLLGDHLGDCVGPCQNICPAHMDIPTMISQRPSAKLLRASTVAYKPSTRPIRKPQPKVKPGAKGGRVGRVARKSTTPRSTAQMNSDQNRRESATERGAPVGRAERFEQTRPITAAPKAMPAKVRCICPLLMHS